MDNDNVIPFGQVKGGKSDDENVLPVNEYSLITMENEEYQATGFLIFTPQHVAVMRDDGKGAIPILVMPLISLRVAELIEDDDEGALF